MSASSPSSSPVTYHAQAYLTHIQSHSDIASYPPNSKRGVSTTNAHSLSVGSGNNNSRPRARLNQQRSADELSKTSPRMMAVNGGNSPVLLSASSPSSSAQQQHQQQQRNRHLKPELYQYQSSGQEAESGSYGHHEGQYSTATAMMHPTGNSGAGSDCFYGSGSRSSMPAKMTLIRSQLTADEIHSNVAAAEVSPRSLSLTAATTRSASAAAAASTATIGYHHQVVETTIMSTSSPMGAPSPLSTLSRMDAANEGDVDTAMRRSGVASQQQQQQQQQRDSRSSIYSLNSKAHLMVLEGADHLNLSLGLDAGGGGGGGVENSLQEDATLATATGSSPSSEMSRLSPSTLPLNPLLMGEMAGKRVGMMSLDPLREPGTASASGVEPWGTEEVAGARSVAGGGDGGGGSSSSAVTGKKHHTMLGASKAAVSGVFGKFRKSVG
ncbi:hypothetical protein EDD11_006775 [Mortierella claussenii]|nr:hypothetical protein EDD11_006775 [Mortierella claussenii]